MRTVRCSLLLRSIACFLVATVSLNGNLSFADRTEAAPSDIEDVGVDEKLDNLVPLDLAFKDERDRDVLLKDYFDGKKPVILTLVFFQCPMLCNLVLDGLTLSMQEMKLDPGKDFEMLTVSFNPLETPALAQTWKQKYVKQYGKAESAKGWHFLTGKNASIRPLADAVGFRYEYVKARQEYAHAAAVMILTPDGHVSRYLYGIEFDPDTLRLSLVEASEGRIGSTMDHFLLTCYYYDEKAGRYAPMAFNIMRIGCGIIIIVVGTFLSGLWLRELKRNQTNAEGAHT